MIFKDIVQLSRNWSVEGVFFMLSFSRKRKCNPPFINSGWIIIQRLKKTFEENMTKALPEAFCSSKEICEGDTDSAEDC